MAYERVNGAWLQAVPALTPQEAITAAKRLWRKWMKRKVPGKVVVENRRRNPGVWFEATEMHVAYKNGWRGLIHSMSHRVHARLHGHTKTYDQHDARHHFIEKEMVEYVVMAGWLDGKLRRPEREKPALEPRAQRQRRVIAAIARWEAKQRRAAKALRKLERQRRYYERQIAA